MPNEWTPKLDKLEKIVEIKEQALLLLESSGTAAIVNLIVAFLTYLSIPSKNHTWFFLIVATSFFRLSLYVWYKKSDFFPGTFLKNHRIVLLSIALQGFAWGFASVYLFSVSIELHKFYLIAITCGMTGGAILTLAPSLVAFSYFTLPCTVPLVLTLLLEQEEPLRYSGFMGIIFIASTHILARRISSSHKELRRSRRKQKKLSEELSRHKDQLEILVEQRTGELEASRENYRQLTEEINDVIFELDPKGRVTYVSPVVTSLLGYQTNDVIGKSFTQFVYPDDLALVNRRFAKVRSGNLKPLEYRVFDSNNTPHWVRSSSRPVMNGDILNAIRGVLSDIEQEKIIEKEKDEMLRRVGKKQQLEAIGILAAGIAHDFNNLLMGISGRTSLMLVNSDYADKNIEHLRALENYVQSAKNLTAQLLGTARGGKYNPRPIDINILARSSLSMFGRTNKEIETNCTTPSYPIVVEADEKQIEQVLLNIYVNAWQAMPKGGKLHVIISTVILQELDCKPYQTEPGQYTKISISDTGKGMDKATQLKVFDPFFTTKEKERGTGLGLASAYGIIKNHGGLISVESEIDKGTTFTIFLPISKNDINAINDKNETIVKSSGRILLVDDEDLILEVGQALLAELGFEVEVAKGGEEAIKRITSSNDKFDLVLLDMIMPQVDGSEVFDKILSFSPELPVILSSGYSIDGQAAAILKKGCNDFIQKPFNISELSSKINKVLHT